MIEEQNIFDEIEVERYELFAAPPYNFIFDRRDFIKAFALGIVFLVPVTRAIAQQRSASLAAADSMTASRMTSAPGFTSMNRAESPSLPAKSKSDRTRAPR